MKTPFEKFDGQITGTLQMLRYLLLMQETFPHVMVQLSKDQILNIGPQIDEWISFSREIYKMPELGSTPPRPLPVDPDCPSHLLSDQIRQRLGRNNPFFDFVNAPFTHPIGTQISITCISSAWNAYDTFVNEISGDIKAEWPTDKRVSALLLAEANLKEIKPCHRLPSEEKLTLLEIAATRDDFAKAARDTGNRNFEPERAELLLVAGKDIRSTFTHRLGEPMDRLLKMMHNHSFEDLGFRMTPEDFEITLFASRNIIEVILIKATTINHKVQSVYRRSG